MINPKRPPYFWPAFLAAAALSASAGFLNAFPSDPPDRFDSVRLKIARVLKESGASGVAIAIAKDGKIILEQGFGFTGHDDKTPVTPDTMFSLASITKALTATGLLVLADRGLVNLDKPADDYLGAAKLTSLDGSAPATVRNLIYHTSGLPMHWHLFYADKAQRAPGMDESIRTYGILTAPPGESYCYSNFGYGVLGHVLAKVSGPDYAEFMKREVFEPLGMTRTAILTEPGPRENVARKYDSGKRELPVCDFDHQGASAAYASVHDLVRFGQFRLGIAVPGQKKILKGETLAAMRRESGSRFADGDVTVKSLLGSFGEFDYLGSTFQVVTGGMPGAVSRLDIIPSEGLISAVLANADGIDLWAVQQEIFAVFLPAFRDTPQKPPANSDSSAPAKFSPADPLLGHWSGAIRTSVKEIPAALTFGRGLDPVLEIDGKKFSPLSVKTELGEMAFKDGIFSGLFWGRIDTPDTTGQSHVVLISVKLRGNKLAGTASAVSIDNRKSFCLPFRIELAKPGR